MEPNAVTIEAMQESAGTEPLFALHGQRSGPILRVVGRKADLCGAFQDFRARDDAARMAGTLEFYAGPLDCLSDQEHLVIDPQDPAVTPTSGCYKEIVERACALGMFPNRAPEFHGQQSFATGQPARKTGTGWKKRVW